MYCRMLSTAEIVIRSVASVSQHLASIPHISEVAPSSTFPLGRRGRSPSSILDLASAALTPPHNNCAVSIYAWLIGGMGDEAL